MRPIIATICLIGSFALMGLVIWPEYKDLREAMIEAEIKEIDLQNMINYNQTMAAMADSLMTDYRDATKKLYNGVPNDHYVPSLFAEIRRASYRTGVRVKGIGDFSVSDHPEKKEIKITEVEFEVEGAYLNFKNFIKAINNSARIMEISTMHMERGPGDKGEPLDYRITLKAYSY